MTEVKKTAAPAAKKKTASSEAIVGQAATILSRGVKAAQEALEKLSVLSDTAEERQNAIADLEVKIAELSTKYAEELRAGKIQIDLDLKAHGIEGAKTIATANGFSVVESAAYSKTVKELETLKADFEKNLTRDVAIQVNAAAANHKNAMLLKEAEIKAEHSELTSQLKTALSQNAFLQSQIDLWKGQLDAERNAGTARAQAASIGNVNVGIPGKN